MTEQRQGCSQSHRVLKTCAAQLCGILQHLFNLSLSQEKVLVLRKASCLVPIPKVCHASTFCDYKAVVLTSHTMKVLERLLVAYLNKWVYTFQDPLQFAYNPGVGVKDVILYLLQRAHSQLDKAGSIVKILFFWFDTCLSETSVLRQTS